MSFLHTYRRSLFLGFLFGTVGLLLLAMLSLAIPFIEYIAMPIFLPGRYIASLLTGSDASSSIIIILYLSTGVLYAAIGMLIQMTILHFHRRNDIQQ